MYSFTGALKTRFTFSNVFSKQVNENTESIRDLSNTQMLKFSPTSCF